MSRCKELTVFTRYAAAGTLAAALVSGGFAAWQQHEATENKEAAVAYEDTGDDAAADTSRYFADRNQRLASGLALGAIFEGGGLVVSGGVLLCWRREGQEATTYHLASAGPTPLVG